MPLVSMSEAIKLSGVGRTKFYEMKNNGEFSVNTDNPKRPMIDTAELLRVFGELNSDQTEETEKRTVADSTEIQTLRERLIQLETKNEGLSALLKAKEEQIEREQESTREARERAMQAEQSYKLLIEDRTKEPKGFWQRLFSQ